MSEFIEFWSVPDNAKLSVPASACRIEVIQTAKGIKKLLRASVRLTSGEVRNLSKFVNKDFEL